MVLARKQAVGAEPRLSPAQLHAEKLFEAKPIADIREVSAPDLHWHHKQRSRCSETVCSARADRKADTQRCRREEAHPEATCGRLLQVSNADALLPVFGSRPASFARSAL